MDAIDTLHYLFILSLFFFIFQQQEPSDWKSLNNGGTEQLLLPACKKPLDLTSCQRSAEHHIFGRVVAKSVDKQLAVPDWSASEPSLRQAIKVSLNCSATAVSADK